MTREASSFDEVLHEAQTLGYAEADPTADVDGFEIVVIDPENLWRAEWGSLHG